jgi:hypothetical protein
VIGRAGVLDGAVGGTHRLVLKSQQPQNSPKTGACSYPLVHFKANDIGSMVGSDIIRERAFDMKRRHALVSEQMLRPANQSLTEQPITRVGPLAARALNRCASLRAQ